MIAIRGAVFVDENTKEDIYKQTSVVLNKIIKSNQLVLENVISIMFSTTNDLDKAYPAVAARELGFVHAGLFCVQEMYVEESAEMCIRVMMHVDVDRLQSEVIHVYVNGAERLRPDLKGK